MLYLYCETNPRHRFVLDSSSNISSKFLQDMSWERLQDILNVTIISFRKTNPTIITSKTSTRRFWNQLMFAGRAKPHFVFENILLLTRRNFSLNHAYWQTSATICIFWKRNNDHIINKTHFWDLKAMHASNNFSYQELVRKKWIIKILMLNLQILNNNRGL